MKKRNILFGSLAVFVLGVHSVFALEEEEGWAKYESGIASVEVDRLKEFEERLSTRVTELNQFDLDKFYRYRVEIRDEEATEDYKEVNSDSVFASEVEANDWANNYKPEEEGWSFVDNIVKVLKLDKLFNLTRFETKEEADEAVLNFENSIDENSGNITITEIRDESEDVTENVDNQQKFNTFEGAIAASEELREDTHDYVVVVDVVEGGLEFVRTEASTFNIVFDTLDEAYGYVTELENQGYTVDSQVNEVNETSTLNQQYEEKLEAEQALADFLEQYPDTTVSNIEAVRDDMEDVYSDIVEGTEEFAREELAEEAAAKLTEDNDVYQVVATTRKGTKSVTSSPESIESEQFDDEVSALNYIDYLKTQGYDVSNLKIELVPFAESVWQDEDGVSVNPGDNDETTFTYGHFDITLLTEFTKIDASGDESNVKGTIEVTDVVINDNDVIMNGPTKDPNTGYMEYTSKERNKLGVTNQSLVEITGTITFKDTTSADETTLPFNIEGYLSESQNVCGGKGSSRGFDLEFKSVTIINDKVIIDSNIVNKYKVTGTVTKTVEQDVWYVDTITMTKGYDYQVTADGVKFIGFGANGTASKDIYENVYTLDVKKIVKGYDYEVEGTGSKTYYEVVSKYVRLANVDWIIESMELGGIDNVDVEVLPPQTGINYSFLLIQVMIGLVSGLFLVVTKFI